MICIVSSPEPFKVKHVVLNGAFDLYGRGRVSNILKTFNFINISRLGAPDKAYRAFKAGYTPNAPPPFGVIAETATGNNPYFATGAGGMIQAMLNGFGGLKISPQALPNCPLDCQLHGKGYS